MRNRGWREVREMTMDGVMKSSTSTVTVCAFRSYAYFAIRLVVS